MTCRALVNSSLCILLFLITTGCSENASDPWFHQDVTDSFSDVSDTNNNSDTSDTFDDSSGPPSGAWADGRLTYAELFNGTLIDTVIIEVDYEEEAEPYSGSGSLDWNYVDANLNRLFMTSGATIQLPNQLNDLESFTTDQAVYGDSYSSTEIRQLSDAHRDHRGAGTTAPIHVLYLDGYYADASGKQDNVLGVSINGERLIAIFVPVVENSTNGPLLNSRDQVEQTILVHELGHAVGLVNAGIPMVNPHEDSEHSGHDIDKECVMYWQIEQSNGIVDFITNNIIGSENNILFCQPSLDDVEAISVHNKNALID